MTGRLAGEVAIVTGSTAGLGKTIATVFAGEGAEVVVTGRHRDRGEAVVAAICRAGGRAAFVPSELTDEESCCALVEEAARRYGSVSVLVNNAVDPEVIARDAAVGDAVAETWRAMFEVNLLGATILSREVIRHMRRSGHGAIVNISSRAAARGTPALAAYAATKAGLESLARSITADHAREGIRCNTVQAGYILNEWRDAGAPPEALARREAMQLTRLATADDVARAALFLASAEAEVITGVTLPVDGGSSAVRGSTLG